MNQYITGTVIKEFRNRNEMTQMELAERLGVSANMLRSHFYVCPVCWNIIHSMGEAVIQCHGIQLKSEEAEETDEEHKIFVERVDDEYYVQIEHAMTKSHYISFVAAISSDRV